MRAALRRAHGAVGGIRGNSAAADDASEINGFPTDFRTSARLPHLNEIRGLGDDFRDFRDVSQHEILPVIRRLLPGVPPLVEGDETKPFGLVSGVEDRVLDGAADHQAFDGIVDGASRPPEPARK
jgi:hypothetical protein